jgi:hypothetical protein
MGSKAEYRIGAALVILCLVACVFMRDKGPASPGTLKQEIYQVRGQLQLNATCSTPSDEEIVESATAVLLRNGGGKDFQVKIPQALPGNTYFVKPARVDGAWTLISVPTIVEEQKAEEATNTKEKQ